MKLPRKGARSSKGPLFMRLLRLFAAILLSQSVVNAPGHSVFAAKDLRAASRNHGEVGGWRMEEAGEQSGQWLSGE
jgi:hypothetical protein